MGEVTELLERLRQGDRSAFAEVFPLVYGELRRLAQSYLEDERTGHTLQATALVHEAYLKLAGQDRADWQNRGQFIAVAAQAMRRILVDHARSRKAAKRDGSAALLELAPGGGLASNFELDALDEALTRLDRIDPRKARVVELRFFGGLTEAEVAKLLGVSLATVQRDWMTARAWLFHEMTTAKGE